MSKYVINKKRNNNLVTLRKKKYFREGRDWIHIDEVKKLAREGGVETRREWQEIAKLGWLPENVPHDPRVYQRRFLLYPTYNDLKFILKKFNIKSQKDYQRAQAKKLLPNDIPAHCHLKKIYGKEFKGLGDLLGTGRISDNYKRKIVFKDFDTCRVFITKKKFKNTKQLLAFLHSDEKPKWLPTHPERVFKKQWKGYPFFMGRYNRNEKWSYDQCQNWFKQNPQLKIHGQRDYMKLWKLGKIPKQMPASPMQYFKRYKRPKR